MRAIYYEDSEGLGLAQGKATLVTHAGGKICEVVVSWNKFFGCKLFKSNPNIDKSFIKDVNMALKAERAKEGGTL